MISSMGTPRIAYRRRASPLHAAKAPVAAAYGLSLAGAALIVSHPLLLCVLLGCVLVAATAAGVGRQLGRTVGMVALPLVVASVIVNMLVSRGGLTVLARLGDWGVLGQMNVTLEAAVYGAVFGLRALIATGACLLIVCAANPDELLHTFRLISPRSALTATLTTRLIPVLSQDARRLAEAQRCRPEGRAKGLRGTVAILRATLSGALERSLDVAAVLEMRGYGVARRRRGRSAAASRHDIAFTAAAIAVLTVALLAATNDAAAFNAYPLVSISLTPLTLALAAALPLISLMPFMNRRGIEP